MKDYSNAITWDNQNNSFSFTGPCGDHSIMYNFTGPIQCWVVQIKLEQFLPVLIPVAHIYGTMVQIWSFRKNKFPFKVQLSKNKNSGSSLNSSCENET
jgi:hypothetical protein